MTTYILEVLIRGRWLIDCRPKTADEALERAKTIKQRCRVWKVERRLVAIKESGE